MHDVAEILADSKIQQAIGALVFDAAREAGISLSHADGVRMSIVGRLEEGKPIDPAVALVQAIRCQAFEDAAAIVSECRDQECDDLRQVRDRIQGVANDLRPV